MSSTRWSADDAVSHLYAAHYASLVRLGTLLLRDQGRAEEVVQDCFVAMHGRWGRLRDPDKALAYLRAAVVNRSRSALRRVAVAERHRPDPLRDVDSAETTALAHADRAALLAALAQLSTRQREVLVLRYYLDLSEADIAATLGISRGAVKTHSSRGISALRTSWERS
ncbi:MAG: SigE family RNA polymerase sigma factor [Nocardioidaceae bacterium]